MPIFLPLLAAAARIAGPAVTKKAVGTVAKAALSKPGLAAMGGYAMGRNSNMQQGQADGQPRENMQNYFPGRGGY
jgi:hypothetical protein